MKKKDYKSRVYGSYNAPKKGKNPLMKILSGVLFALACFVAVFVLVEFHDVYPVVGVACLMLMGAAFFFLSQLFASKEDEIDDLLKAQEALEAVREEEKERADEEFKRHIEEQVGLLNKTNKAMFMAMKKSAEAQDAAMEKMHQEMDKKIDKVIDAQNAGVKTMIKFNKENTRQAALKEEQTLNRMLGNITDEIKENREAAKEVKVTIPAGAMPVVQAAPVEEITVEEPLAEEAFSEEVSTEELTIEDPVIEEPVVEEPIEGAVVEEAEEPVVEEPVIEEPVVEEIAEPVPEAASLDDALANTGVDLSDPNAALSADDIAKLFAAAGGASAEAAPVEEPIEETVEEPAEPEASLDDALAGTGVDLSDPNAALSADDIAKLFAAAGSVSEPAPAPEPEPSLDDALASTGVDLSDPNAALSADDIAKLFAAAGN